MKARDAPESLVNPPDHIPPNYQISAPTPAPKLAPTATRANKVVEPSKLKAKAPKDSRAKRPPNVGGYTWRKDGAGW
jgi:hypothetical protein